MPQSKIDRNKPPLVQIEVFEEVRVPGFVEASIEIVDPGVVRALEARHAVAFLRHERCAPVAAEIEEGANGAVVIADDDQILFTEACQEILPRQLDIFLTADADPALREPRFLFVGEDLWIMVHPRR
ncbi:MAG: hypothetical protein KatS3mg059_1643 [Thermomicrobiales bacterium]|nr:MAG: hypothetical protein KatS3mg059_1643 [Thermomicrobiales bacterium]